VDIYPVVTLKKNFKFSEGGEKSSSLYKVGFKPAGPLTVI